MDGGMRNARLQRSQVDDDDEALESDDKIREIDQSATSVDFSYYQASTPLASLPVKVTIAAQPSIMIAMPTP